MDTTSDLRGHLLAERELLFPVGGPVDEVLEDGDDDEEVGEALDQPDLPHAAVVEDGHPPVGQTLHQHAVVDLALLLVLQRLVHRHQVPELDLGVRRIALNHGISVNSS